MSAKGKSSWQLIGPIALVLLLLGTFLWWRFAYNKAAPLGVAPDMSTLSPQEKFQVQLYFSDASTGELIAQTRSIPKLPLLESQIKLVLNELIAGPKLGQLQATIPPESQLREFYLDEQGCAYLDFDAKLKRNHPGGAFAELLTIASLVNTATRNFTQIKQVKLLINGAEIETLAGHIDTRFAFTPQNLSLQPLPANI